MQPKIVYLKPAERNLPEQRHVCARKLFATRTGVLLVCLFTDPADRQVQPADSEMVAAAELTARLYNEGNEPTAADLETALDEEFAS